MMAKVFRALPDFFSFLHVLLVFYLKVFKQVPHFLAFLFTLVVPVVPIIKLSLSPGVPSCLEVHLLVVDYFLDVLCCIRSHGQFFEPA